MHNPVLIVLGVLIGATSLSGAATAAKLQTRYLHPQTGVPLPVEPLEAVPGCLCSVHYKNVPGPKEPAKPFRQGVIDAPSVDSIPPLPLQDANGIYNLLKGDSQ